MNCYVYQIVYLPTLKSYIGSRTRKGCNPIGLGIKYFSSSRNKNFILEQKNNPKDFLYFILKEFGKDYKSCIDYEIYLHNKYNVGVNKRFYNKSKQTSTGFSTAGIKFDKEHCLKLSNIQKIRKRKLHSQETKDKIGVSRTGQKSSQETKNKISISSKGENNGNSKITEHMAHKIKIDTQKKKYRICDVAKKYSVSWTTASLIKHNKTWSYIKI